MRIKMTVIVCTMMGLWLLGGTSYADEYYDEGLDSYSSPTVINNTDDNTSAYDNDEQAQPIKTTNNSYSHKRRASSSAAMPAQVSTGEDVIVVNPSIHRWAAYGADGQLLRTGIASAGANWCADIGRRCRTKVGTFRINSLGSASCISSIYPLGKGGAPMPYCMYFNGSQGIHGSHEIGNANMSHGCVRVSVSDAAWIRFNFAKIGTKVIILPY